MPLYQVFLHNGVTTGIEVSEKGIIVNSTKLENAIGLNFARFSTWVKEKGGKIVAVNEPRSLERPSYLW
jgi:hypothetical protein